MTIDCGACNPFRDRTQRYFQDTLARFGFQLTRCSADYNGRECVLLYESSRCQLLFLLSDGAESCTVGSDQAQFPDPDVGLYEDGQLGWYHVISLIEFKSGKKLLTRRLLDEVMEGKRDYFAWQSQLLADWADTLFDMFAPGQEQQWQSDFAKYVQAKQATS